MLKRVLLAFVFLAGSIVFVLPAFAFIGNGAEIMAPALSKSTQLILAKAEAGRDAGNKHSGRARDGDDDHHHNHHHHHHHHHHNHHHHHHHHHHNHHHHHDDDDGDGSN